METFELEQLRKLNNELEEAHLALEVKLYQELDIKDQVINELTSRFKLQSLNLNMQQENITIFRNQIDSLKDKLEDQDKFSSIKTEMIQKLQKLRLCEASAETLETRLHVETILKNIVTSELDLFKVWFL